MAPTDASRLARQLLAEHLDNTWRFEWDRARRRYGYCSFTRKVISLSYPLTVAGQEAEVRDTILHEIAHALAGSKAGHGIAWRQACRRIGARPTRCGPSTHAAIPHRFVATCPVCGQVFRRDRRPRAGRRTWCRRCVNSQTANPDNILTWVRSALAA